MLIKEGYKNFGESGMRWLVFKGEPTEDELENLGIVEHYEGPGRFFARRPFIQRCKNRTLVTQIVGLDV